MILKREGQQRKEVDLTSPEALEVPLVSGNGEPQSRELPRPVCPDGSPGGDLPLDSVVEDATPGQSPLDAGIQRLAEGLGGGPGEAKREQGGAS